MMPLETEPDMLFMPDDVCMVQVMRVDEHGLVSQTWIRHVSFTDTVEMLTEILGKPSSDMVTQNVAAIVGAFDQVKDDPTTKVIFHDD